MPGRGIRARHVITNRRDRVRDTVRLIGQGIRAGSSYLPLRMHVAQLASRAGQKDYLGQLREIYDDFLERWRYVYDPSSLETVSTSGEAVWGIVAGANRRDPRERGFGDCAHACSYIGAAAQAIGLPVRIVTMAHPGQGPREHTHVYAEVRVPGRGWIAADPVAYPKPMGYRPPASSRKIWDLSGKEIPPTLGRFTPKETSVLKQVAQFFLKPTKKPVITLPPKIIDVSQIPTTTKIEVPDFILKIPGMAEKFKRAGPKIEKLKGQLEKVRQAREEMETQFENIDQKRNQLFDLLSKVMKQEQEARSAIVRSLM